MIAYAFNRRRLGGMTYQEFRKAEPYSQPDYQGDHVRLSLDGGPTPTGWLLAGFIEAVPRSLNQDRTEERLRDQRCSLPLHERKFRNSL